jgi:glycosyltransferase involved in cell wall biosynthesis
MQRRTLNDLPPPPPGREGWPWTVESVPLPDTLPDGAPWPRISIVTPSFNQAQFLEQTLRSILLQGYPDFELLVVDGGSTDGSVAILEKYAAHLTWWVSERDAGQSDAINKGCRRATGEAVGWLNSDDVFYPNALEAMGRAFHAHPEAGLIYGAGAKVDIECRVLKPIPYRPVNPRLLGTLFYILQPSSMFRRKALDTVGLLREDLHFVMDWDLALRIAARFDLVAIHEPIAMLRDYPETKTRTPSDRRFLELIQIAREHQGVWDRNVLVFWLLYPIVRCRRATQWRWLDTLDHWVRRALGRIVSENTYMAHSFR